MHANHRVRFIVWRGLEPLIHVLYHHLLKQLPIESNSSKHNVFVYLNSCKLEYKTMLREAFYKIKEKRLWRPKTNQIKLEKVKEAQ